jgi:hypothetical protein
MILMQMQPQTHTQTEMRTNHSCISLLCRVIGINIQWAGAVYLQVVDIFATFHMITIIK